MWRQTEFFETPIMPTYMISITISDFKCLTYEVNSQFAKNFSCGVCGVSTTELALALNISKYSIEFLEDYFKSSFHLPKIGKSN